MAILTHRLPDGSIQRWPVRWHRNGTIVDEDGIALMEMPGQTFAAFLNIGDWRIHIQQAPQFESAVRARWLGWPASENPEVVQAFFDARAMQRSLTPSTTRADTTRTRL
jgi:hypothetical protein